MQTGDSPLATADFVRVIAELTALVMKYEAALAAFHVKHQELDAAYDKALAENAALKEPRKE